MKDIKLSVLGFGKNPKHIERMKEMTSYAKGNYLQIATNSEMPSVLIDEIKKQSLIK